MVEDLRDVEIGAGERGDLVDPGAIFAVVDLGEHTLEREFARPGADMPRTAERGGAGLPGLVEAAGEKLSPLSTSCLTTSYH